MDQFDVRLDKLDDLANNRLPAIAQSLANAHGSLKEATSRVHRAFDTRSNSDGDQPWSTKQPHRFYLFWQPGNECFFAMDFMRQVFEDNCENVNLAAQAMREIAARYRQADGQ